MDKEQQRAQTRERVKRYRAKQQIKALHGSVTYLDTCQYCGKPIVALGYSRKYPGACYDCAIKPHPKTADDLWPKYRWSNESNYKMTDFERGHYRPASELDDGEYNPVSKPGDEHYLMLDAAHGA